MRQPPPLTEPERNAVPSLPTVTNSRTDQRVCTDDLNIIAFLSEPVKGKPPYGGGFSVPPVLNLRTVQFILNNCVKYY